jgi:hypothetical protein
MSVYEIHAASKDHSEDEIRAGATAAFAGWTVEAIKDAGDEWQVRLVKNADDKPPFLQEKKDDAPADDMPDDVDDAVDSDAADDGESDKGDSKDKGDKPKGDVVSELKDLMGQLQDVIKQVSDKAGEAVSETEEHRDKLDKAKDALGEEGGLPGLDDVPGLGDDAPAPPLPGGAKPAGPGGKKPPFGGPKSVVPGRPGIPSGGGPGLPTFTNVEVATHPGVDEKGARISLLAAAQSLESDPDFSDYEVVGMIENADGSYSAKLKKKQSE